MSVLAEHSESLVPHAWEPKAAGDRVLARLKCVTSPEVKGAHDAEMVMVGDRAFIVAEVSDTRAGESADWPEVYVAMSIVDLSSLSGEKVIPVARGGQKFDNESLPRGACFVPRIIQKDSATIRCFFASEEPRKRQAQTWHIDFDLERMAFENRIEKARLKTTAGTFDMQPQHFYKDATRYGHTGPEKDYGFYIFDSFKKFEGRTYVALNNYPGGQNALAVLLEDFATFEVVGHYNSPSHLKLTESSVNRLPDNSWLAVCRQEGGNRNYVFTTSKDGKKWTDSEERDFLSNGSSSKPTFDCFGGIYYLGWQENTKIDNANRSVFNVDVSRNGKTWARKYRFETSHSFQYPSFREHDGHVWVCVTQGDSSPSRKERIMFGRLEQTGEFAE